MQPLHIEGGFRKYEEVAFLRGFAMLSVVLMHLLQVWVSEGDLPGWLRLAASLGGTGGHVFIICSGFGLYLSWMRRPLKYGEFLRKRFVKIYLPYIAVVFVEYVLYFDGFASERTKALLSHIFLYKMFIDRYNITFGLQFWFISTIFQFYFLFIPLCRLLQKLSRRYFFLLCLGISAAWWVFTEVTGLAYYRVWSSFCLQYLWEFALGMLLAEHLGRGQSLRTEAWLLPAVMICGLGLQALSVKLGGWAAVFNDVPGTLGYTALALQLYQYGKRVIRPVGLWLNTVSYEWYLTHVLAFGCSYRCFRPLLRNETVLAVLAFLCSLLFAWGYAAIIRLVRRRRRVT
ncbi:MAG: acyltransferase [Oscillospiraceae bacterium]|nr:acyltransferase [Oscillospiraceae bacterium]